MMLAWLIGMMLGGVIDVAHGGDIPTIGGALAIARPGDTIRVHAGIYREHGLLVDRRLHLVGIGRPVVDAGGKGFVFRIVADGATIEGFTITGTGFRHTRDDAGIEIVGVRDVTIRNNHLTDTFFGVYLAESRHIRVEGNRITASGRREATSGNGVHLFSSDSCAVVGNRIRGHRDGIYLEFVRGAEIRGNHSEGNIRYGLHYMFSDNSVYHGNTFVRNGAGVAVMYSKNVRMDANRFEWNRGSAAYGLLLKDITDSRITANRFLGNTIAMHVEGSSRLLIEGNVFRSNGWGMKVLANSLDNHIHTNDFIENTFDMATNSRSHVNRIERNHWSRYEGYDLDRDGLGDIPYRPVRLYAVLVERHPIALILVRSLFIALVDLAERVFPILTPEAMTDATPQMKPLHP